MPPTPLPAGFGVATIKYQNNNSGQIFVTDLGFTDDPTATAASQATAISSAWLGSFTAATSLNSYSFIGVAVLINRGGTYLSGQHIEHVAGTVNAEAVSPAIAVRVTKYTGIAGRKHRGRFYLPPAFLPEANVNTAGVIDAATQSGIQGRMNSFLAAINALAQGPVVLLHSDASTPDPIADFQVRSTVGTQRRRQLIA
jgi:hypothetical protein